MAGLVGNKAKLKLPVAAELVNKVIQVASIVKQDTTFFIWHFVKYTGCSIMKVQNCLLISQARSNL